MNKLVWRGPAVLSKVMSACEGGVKDTIDASSEQAASETWVRTGRLAGSVRSHPRPVQKRGLRVIGLWGSRNYRYAFIELGTVHMAGGHFLTRAADAHYPSLVGRIRRRY